MKKIVTLILLTCMLLSLAACADNNSTESESSTPESTTEETTTEETTTEETTTEETTTEEDTTPEITLQEIYDATRLESILNNHRSVSIRDKIDGELFNERYLTKEYIYDCYPSSDAESDFAEFIADDACYCYMDGGYLHYLPITPGGVSDFKSLRAEHYAADVLSEDILKDTIESVSQKDGRITVKSFLSQAAIEDMSEFGVTSGKFEYVLDAKTREIISVTSDYTYDDGLAFCSVMEVTYDAEEPETLKLFLEYADRTEDMRSITVVSNPGTEGEKTETVQTPKGLVIGFRYEEDSEYEFVLYNDAACTELYDPYEDTDSDLTVYVKWDK